MTQDPRHSAFRLAGQDAPDFLDGQLLLAMPNMQDPRFQRSVIYVCAHTAEGAMGIVVNQKARKVQLPELLVQLEVVSHEESIRLPPQADQMPVLKGGPVDTGRGFVLHSADYHVENSTMEIDDAVSLTATLDILRAIARGEGPRRAVLALGYANWGAGQLEAEIQANGWLNCPADAHFLFDPEHGGKYDRAMRKIGVDPILLSTHAGRA